MPAQDSFDLTRSLFLLTDPNLPARDATERALAGLRGGASHIVVRRPNDTPAEVFEMATRLSPTVHGGSWEMLVHERVDIALATHAKGAMVRLNGIPCAPAKEQLLGPERMLGISVHSLEQALAAHRQQADFVVFGNVYETESHPGRPGAGLEVLARVAQGIPIPVIAIGGITAQRVDEVLAAGASGVAVIRVISRADDAEGAARELREALDAADYPHLTERRHHDPDRQ